MSDEMIPTSPSQWDYYQIPYSHHHQTSFQPAFSVSPETVLDTNPTLLRDDQTATSGQIIPSPPRNPSAGESMSPKSGVAKRAVRRRSRASKKAPTTLLNASLTNFRSLVQQYTGCHSSSPHSSILRNQRGPITLSFGPPPGSDFPTSGEQAWHHGQEQRQLQGQHLMYNNHNSFVDTTSFAYSVRSTYGVMRGKSCVVYYNEGGEDGLFTWLPNPFTAEDGLIMAARHKVYQLLQVVQ
nr:VQ motif-containing protein 22-like [Ipomoea batatas]